MAVFNTINDSGLLFGPTCIKLSGPICDYLLYSVHSIFCQRSFKFHGASLWNELPKYLKDIQYVKKFKELLKLHLLS